MGQLDAAEVWFVLLGACSEVTYNSCECQAQKDKTPLVDVLQQPRVLCNADAAAASWSCGHCAQCGHPAYARSCASTHMLRMVHSRLKNTLSTATPLPARCFVCAVCWL
jgi:hypothetical protein